MIDESIATTQIILQDGALLLTEAVTKSNHLGYCLRLMKAGIFIYQDG
jgi:hypothetical protein